MAVHFCLQIILVITFMACLQVSLLWKHCWLFSLWVSIFIYYSYSFTVRPYVLINALNFMSRLFIYFMTYVPQVRPAYYSILGIFLMYSLVCLSPKSQIKPDSTQYLPVNFGIDNLFRSLLVDLNFQIDLFHTSDLDSIPSDLSLLGSVDGFMEPVDFSN